MPPNDPSRAAIARRDFVVRCARGAGAALLAGVGAPWLAACVEEPAGGATGPVAFSPRLTARPGEPTRDAPVGATALAVGIGRDGVLYVPPSYDPAVATPLLVLFHGGQQSGTVWQPFYEAADREGFVILAPDSRADTWDLAITARFGPDVAFLDAALAATFDRVRVDASRIAFGGFSDGASFALSLGVSNGDLARRLIGFAPGFFTPSDPIVGQPPVFLAHGADDQFLDPAFTENTLAPALRGNGYVVTFRGFDGGHEIPPTVRDEALAWWLDQQ